MLSQTTEYALRAMTCLAQSSDQLMPTPVLADLADVPPNYLAKVLQQLASADLIVGRRGVGGGYRLARPAGEIRMLDIVNAVGSVRRFEEPETEKASKAGVSLAGLYRRLDDAARRVVEIYEESTLRDIALDHAPSAMTIRPAPDGGLPPARPNGQGRSAAMGAH
jgi:Rrf2 family nitric oxide-sensitive transcriptional repressor